MHPRSGLDQLCNERVGFDVSTALKAEASSQAAAQQKKGEGAVDQKYGKGTSSSAKSFGGAASDFYKGVVAPPPVSERYSGNYWNPTSDIASDESFQKLKKALDDSAAMSDSVRQEREDDLRKRSAAAGSIAAVYVPYGTAFAAALYAVTEAFIAVGNWLNKNDNDSQENRDRAKNAVEKLWGEWLIKPPAYAADLESAKGYADRVENILNILQASEDQGEPWRARWKQAMAAGIQSPVPAARDVSRLGWIPIDGTSWLGIGYFGGKWKSPYKDKGFGTVTTVHHKPGFLSAGRETTDVYTVPTYDEMAERMDPYAAGVGVMVAVWKDVAIEPVVEAAVSASRRWLEASGPDGLLAGFRLKGVFEAAEEAARTAPKNPMLVKRAVVDSRLDRIALTRDALILKKESFPLLAEAVKKFSLDAEAVKKISLEDRGFRFFRQWRTLRNVNLKKEAGK
jgi:hypothetical protein